MWVCQFNKETYSLTFYFLRKWMLQRVGLSWNGSLHRWFVRFKHKFDSEACHSTNSICSWDICCKIAKFRFNVYRLSLKRFLFFSFFFPSLSAHLFALIGKRIFKIKWDSNVFFKSVISTSFGKPVFDMWSDPNIIRQ